MVVVVSPIALALVALFVVAGLRARHIRTLTILSRAHRPLGPNGVVIGGDGFTLERVGAPAVLLLHGGGDTPQTLRHLGDALYARGFHVDAPLLPGHGRSLDDFARVTANDLTRASRSAYDALRRTHDRVGVIGLSMGGALAVQIAADAGNVDALGLVAPYLSMPKKIQRAARLSWLWGWLVPVVRSGDGVSIFDPVERARGLAYGVFTAAGLRALWITMQRGAAALPRVTSPTLFIQSREDNRITVADGERAFARVGAPDKHIEWITGAGHVITVDYGRDHVIDLLAAWMETHLRMHP